MDSAISPPPSSPNGSAREAAVRDHEVLVVGGGASGIGAAIKLREAGIEDFALLEKAGELGGTWRDNTYPGCACDIPSALYSYSFEPNPDWTRVFAKRPEIQRYLLDVAERHGVYQHARFGAELLDARWDDVTHRWTVETPLGRFRAPVLIFGAGPLHEPSLPDLPGIGRFRGKMFHSARWDHDHDLRGERVAVVGTGASAVQFVPHIQREVEQLHVFQRTPAWVVPRYDPRISPAARKVLRVVPPVNRALRAALWAGVEVLTEAAHHPALIRQLQRMALIHLRRQVRDPALREALEPHFTLGCKRILISNRFYPALTRSNVELVPAPVSEIREGSIVDATGTEREVDTIIWGTGFHITDLPIATRIRRDDGRSLADVWQGSPQAYQGTTVSSFPNLFMLFGPNIGVASAFALIEAQVGYVVDGLEKMRREGISTVDVRPEIQAAYNEKVQQALRRTVWNAGGCRSYYLDANGRNSTVWPWSMLALKRRLRRFDLDAYETRAPVPTAVPV